MKCNAMKLSKTCQQNKTEEDRISDLAVVVRAQANLSSTIVDCDNLMNEFSNTKDRRIQLSSIAARTVIIIITIFSNLLHAIH